MIAGKDAFKPGEGKNSWLSGTASWNFFTITQYILGIRPDYEGILVDPCIPKAWDGFKITRNYRGAVYNIEVKNPDHISKGVKQIIVDGNPIQGNVIPKFASGTNHNVEVIMG